MRAAKFGFLIIGVLTLGQLTFDSWWLNKTKPDPSLVAIPVRQEFKPMLRRSIEMTTMHAELESQPRDPTWASATEKAYRLYFSEGKPELLRYGMTSEIECRTNMCEVRLLAYGADKAMNWYRLLEKPGLYPSPTGSVPVVVNWDEHDGVTAIFIITKFQNRTSSNIEPPKKKHR